MKEKKVFDNFNFIILKKQTEYFGIIQKIAHVKHALIRICTVFNFSFAKVNENVFSSEEGDKINFYIVSVKLSCRFLQTRKVSWDRS